MPRRLKQSLALLVIFYFSAPPAFSSHPPEVPTSIFDLGVSRINGILSRYIIYSPFFDEYPCLVFETLNPKKDPPERVDRMEVCSIEPKDSPSVSFRNSTRTVRIADMQTQGTHFAFRVEYLTGKKASPMFYSDCTVEVKKSGKLGPLNCDKKQELDLSK